MRITRIYHPREIQVGDSIELESGAANHVARVLRMKPGEILILFNNTGNEYPARIEGIAKHTVSVEILDCQTVEKESPLQIHLGQGLCRGEKMDWVIQKSVELGVNEITPLMTRYGSIKLDGERLLKKMEHWQKVAISACEQCGRVIIPVIHQPMLLEDWLKHLEIDQGFLLHHLQGEAHSTLDAAPKKAAILIGPEGGFSPGELKMVSQDQRFEALTLGPRIMRTETAAIAAISVLQSKWGDWR